MPTAITRIATTVNAGAFSSERTAKRTSCQMYSREMNEEASGRLVRLGCGMRAPVNQTRIQNGRGQVWKVGISASIVAVNRCATHRHYRQREHWSAGTAGSAALCRLPQFRWKCGDRGDVHHFRRTEIGEPPVYPQFVHNFELRAVPIFLPLGGAAAWGAAIQWQE